jgi:hypothetical protein
MMVIQEIHNGNPTPFRWVVQPDTTGFAVKAYVYSLGGATSMDLDITMGWFAIGK